MYFWTATLAFPITILAFAPIWVALLAVAVLATIAIAVTRNGKKDSVYV
jgi:UDP-GlcNAc:undecaprenyl-phosphate GlcNAc-1-phosphate transferase